MGRAVELSNVHDIIFVFQNSSLVVVQIEVIRCAENCHDARKPGSTSLSVHTVSSILGLVSANDREQVVLLKESTCRRIGKEVRAAPNTVVDKIIRRSLLPKLLQRVSPQYITHESMSRWFPETIDLRRKGSLEEKQLCDEQKVQYIPPLGHPGYATRDLNPRGYKGTVCSLLLPRVGSKTIRCMLRKCARCTCVYTRA